MLEWELSLICHFTFKTAFKGINFIRRTNSKRNIDEKTNRILPLRDWKSKGHHGNTCYVYCNIKIKSKKTLSIMIYIVTKTPMKAQNIFCLNLWPKVQLQRKSLSQNSSIFMETDQKKF